METAAFHRLLERVRRAFRARRCPIGVRRHPWHSVSSTREYERCPRRYWFGYVEKRPYDRPSPPSWRFGSVVHEGLEAGYRHAMEHPGIRGSERLRVAQEAVAESWRRYEMDDDGNWQQRAVWHVTRALAKDGIGADTILGVEVAIRDDLDEDERVCGFADLVLRRPGNVVQIVDHKVTRWRSTPERLQDDFQLNLYGYLARQRWPWAERIIGTHHYPTGPDAVSADLTEEGMAGAFERVRAAATAIADDVDFRPTPSERCSHCPWQPSCPEGTAFLPEA